MALNLSDTELIVMLKAVGCNIDMETHEVSFFNENFLNNILNGEVNPFQLVEVN